MRKASKKNKKLKRNPSPSWMPHEVKVKLTPRQRRTIREQELQTAKEEGYQQGLKDGIKQERESLAAESLKVRLELGRSYAAVFDGIARTALMLFDNGAGLK